MSETLGGYIPPKEKKKNPIVRAVENTANVSRFGLGVTGAGLLEIGLKPSLLNSAENKDVIGAALLLSVLIAGFGAISDKLEKIQERK